jgi:signal transduction histidine kinase
MISNWENFAAQLRSVCKMPGASWAIWLAREGNQWNFYPPESLSKARRTALRNLIAEPQTSNWLAGALSSGRVRSHTTSIYSQQLGSHHVYIFPNPKAKALILVAADQLEKSQRDFFQVLAMICPLEFFPLDIRLEEEVLTLQQLTLLNQLALEAAGGLDIDEVARGVVVRLRQTFETDQVVVLLLSQDGKTLLEYGDGVEGVPPMVIPVELSLAGYVIEQMKPVRYGDIRDAPRFYPPMPDVHSALIVPLMYRNEIVGTICLQSNLGNVFTDRDERLLVVIASHLAGLFENVRLNQETRERAMKLSLIHQVVQRMVGLVDEVEIAKETAELMSEYFGYELVTILMADAGGNYLTLAGVGGNKAHLLPANFQIPTSEGITGLVYRQSKGNYFNDVSTVEEYFPLPGWRAGSEMCVPLLDGAYVLGVIDVERSEKNSFTWTDLLVLESLAGILSSVILAARRYQELQERIEAQRETEKRLKQLYDELQLSMESLEKSQKALLQAEKMAVTGRLTASIAHEINNPLQSLNNCLHLAGRNELPPEIREKYRQIAESELDRLMVTVKRMLDLYRPNARERQWTDLEEIFDRVLTLLGSQLRKTNVRVHTQFADDVPKVLVVSSQIQQVLLNLLLNAIEAMSNGGEVFIKVDHSNDGAEIILTDTGAGILVSERERIFEPFVSTKPDGTGLGLTVSYAIIQSHGGTIELLSDRGEGASFRIVIPTGESP